MLLSCPVMTASLEKMYNVICVLSHSVLFTLQNIPAFHELASHLQFTDILGMYAATASFKSHQRFSMGFMSGDCDSHSRIFQNFFCFGLLSCWKVQCCLLLSFLTDSMIFPHTYSYFIGSILSSCHDAGLKDLRKKTLVPVLLYKPANPCIFSCI